MKNSKPIHTLVLILAITLLLNPIALMAQEAISYKELQKYLSDNISGFVAASEPDGNQMSMGTMSMSNASRSYKKGDVELNISIVDYKQAAMMYMSATAVWNNSMSVENDEEKAGTTELDGMKGWEVYHKKDNRAELMLGIHDRYFATFELSEGNIDQLKSIAKSLNLTSLPKE